MPSIIEIKQPQGGRYVIISTSEDMIERIDPRLWFGAYKFFQMKELAGCSEDEARKESVGTVLYYQRKQCPKYLLDLLVANKKRDQEILLRGQSITQDDLICWFLRAGEIGGLFSQYAYDGGSGDLSGRAPIFIDASDTNRVIAVGETDLSDAAMKHLVETQNKIIAQIIDFADGRWLCFYRTHRGLAGRESGNHGQHMHFISSAYGVKRTEIIEGFKNGECPSNGFHVKFVDLNADNR